MRTVSVDEAVELLSADRFTAMCLANWLDFDTRKPEKSWTVAWFWEEDRTADFEPFGEIYGWQLSNRWWLVCLVQQHVHSHWFLLESPLTDEKLEDWVEDLEKLGYSPPPRPSPKATAMVI